MERLIYLDDYSDEVCPCDPTLDAWAGWLSKPARNWGRRKAAKDGESFRASAIELGDDIVATRSDDGKWSFDKQAPDGSDFFAVRFAQGLGWEAESIKGSLGDIIDWLVENEDRCEDLEHIAVGRSIFGLSVTYHVNGDGKASCTCEAIQ